MQALVRELDEEAGAVANDLEPLGYRVDDPVEGRSYIWTYCCRATLPAFVRSDPGGTGHDEHPGLP